MPLNKKTWFSPPNRPWLEFIVIVALLLACAFSMVTLLLNERENKRERLALLTQQQALHRQIVQSIKVRDVLLKQALIKLGVPEPHLDEVLKKDPIY